MITELFLCYVSSVGFHHAEWNALCFTLRTYYLWNSLTLHTIICKWDLVWEPQRIVRNVGWRAGCWPGSSEKQTLSGVRTVMGEICPRGKGLGSCWRLEDLSDPCSISDAKGRRGKVGGGSLLDRESRKFQQGLQGALELKFTALVCLPGRALRLPHDWEVAGARPRSTLQGAALHRGRAPPRSWRSVRPVLAAASVVWLGPHGPEVWGMKTKLLL